MLNMFKIIPSLPYAMVLKLLQKKVWLVCERANEACDNGAAFFKYAVNNDDGINVYYAIKKGSSDYQFIRQYPNIIEFGSIKHWAYYLISDVVISSQKHNGPNTSVAYLFRKLNLKNDRVVFLGHGITKDNADWLHYENTKFGMFICGAVPEYRFVLNKFNYPPFSVVNAGGLCRYDYLFSEKRINKTIFVMPTWRNWLIPGDPKTKMIEGTNQFEKTRYFTTWNSLLSSKRLQEMLEENSIQLLFYPHPEMQQYIEKFVSESNNIRVIKKGQESLSQLICKSDMLLTDYSSVFFDFIYLSKPISFYHFDYEDYRKYQYAEGYFDYERNPFGKVAHNEDELFALIEEVISSGFSVNSNYKENREKFFLNNENYCKKTYELVFNHYYSKGDKDV